MTAVETSLKQHSDDQNQLIHDYAMARIAEMELSVQTASNDVRLHAQLEVTPVDTCPADTEEVFQAVVGDAFADVEKWFIDVGIVKAGQRRADIDVQWEAEVIDDAGTKKLRVTASKEACDDQNAGISSEEGETLTYIVNGIWCGDQPTISENAGNVADPLVGDNAVDPQHFMTLNTGAAADAHAETAGRNIASVQ